jgi:hypothetical protein
MSRGAIRPLMVDFAAASKETGRFVADRWYFTDTYDAQTTNGRSYRFSTGLLEGASEHLRLERS